MDNDGSISAAAATSTSKRREHPSGRALLSLLVPGLGQLAQHRFVAASVQFGTVAAYLVTALAIGSGWSLLLAVFWNLWSVIDAYRHERGQSSDARMLPSRASDTIPLDHLTLQLVADIS